MGTIDYLFMKDLTLNLLEIAKVNISNTSNLAYVYSREEYVFKSPIFNNLFINILFLSISLSETTLKLLLKINVPVNNTAISDTNSFGILGKLSEKREDTLNCWSQRLY